MLDLPFEEEGDESDTGRRLSPLPLPSLPFPVRLASTLQCKVLRCVNNIENRVTCLDGPVKIRKRQLMQELDQKAAIDDSSSDENKGQFGGFDIQPHHFPADHPSTPDQKLSYATFDGVSVNAPSFTTVDSGYGSFTGQAELATPESIPFAHTIMMSPPPAVSAPIPVPMLLQTSMAPPIQYHVLQEISHATEIAVTGSVPISAFEQQQMNLHLYSQEEMHGLYMQGFRCGQLAAAASNRPGWIEGFTAGVKAAKQQAGYMEGYR